MKSSIITFGAALLLPFAAVFTLIYFGIHRLMAFNPFARSKFFVTFHPQPESISLR